MGLGVVAVVGGGEGGGEDVWEERSGRRRVEAE